MSKTIKITEDKFKRVLREVFKEEIYQDNRDPFADQRMEREGTPYEGVEDGHGESIVGKPVDPTIYQPNQELNRYGVKGNGMA
jgi:hypothetical protein